MFLLYETHLNLLAPLLWVKWKRQTEESICCVGTCCWMLVTVKLCWFQYWYTGIISVSLILPNMISFFHKDEGKTRFVIAFKILTFAMITTQVGFESLFLQQFSATNRAFVVRSILVDYSYMRELTSLFISSWEHRSKVSIVQNQKTGQRSQYKLVGFSWDCDRASQRILVASQWQFPKDQRDHASVGNKGCVPLGGSGLGFVIQDHTDHGAWKEQSFRKALREFQKVCYFKNCVCTWVIELFPEWLVLLHGLLVNTIFSN